ncbi:hypothetical protein ILUMI_10832 [Ignelater luminosus]|uniref:Uncharacterized protein n=1 Tax=Ignelater luminosus TaxID=2038154 RepID=A0A8K0D365_IGNLU|nr:hypothetical protein ILUMI_10832 [Ignelater luminosus]
MQKDLGASADRIMIFGKEANLRFPSACGTWLVNGTFKVSPSLFDQVFGIHGYRIAVYRKLHSLPEVLHQYSNDPEFAHKIHQLYALAFIPPDDVQLVYDVLMDEPFFVVDGIQTLLVEFTTYFELT